MKILHPIPSKIKHIMCDPEIKLSELIRYLNPGIDGSIFYNYQMQFIKKLYNVGIKNFIDLKKENDKIKEKASNYSASIRIHIQSQYKFFVDQYEASLKYWDSLSEEQKTSLENDYIIEETEDKMKLNIIKLNKEIQTKGFLIISKESIESDMNVIFDHYKNDTNNLPDELKSFMDEFDPIEFGRVYLSKLMGLNLKFEDQGNSIKITK